MAATKRRVNVINPDDVVNVDVLATEIVKLSKSAQALLATRLNESTLLWHQSGVPRKTCKIVLEAARDLAKNSLKGGA